MDYIYLNRVEGSVGQHGQKGVVLVCGIIIFYMNIPKRSMEEISLELTERCIEL
jgi:hypothetical protein